MTTDPRPTGDPLPIFGDDDPGDRPRPRRDRWGRSIARLEEELADAWRALDAAAARTTAAYDATWTARSDAAEDRAWRVWQTAHDAQNLAARRLHAANTALGRPARDDRR